MKTKNVTLAAVLLAGFLLFNSNQIFAQEQKGPKGKCEQTCMKEQDNPGKSCMNIPDLTPDQQKKIDDLKIKFRKEMLQLNLKSKEAQARLKTLETGENVKLSEIDATIDEITALQNQKMKIRARHKQDIRNLLNEKQRIYFDTQCTSEHKERN